MAGLKDDGEAVAELYYEKYSEDDNLSGEVERVEIEDFGKHPLYKELITLIEERVTYALP